MIAAALIVHRDGIVGQWQGNKLPAGTQLALDTPDQLELWEYWVRATLFDLDLDSNVQFCTDAKSAVPRWAGLWHMKATVLGTGTTPPRRTGIAIAQMTRPDPAGAFFDDQLDLVNGYADLREDRAAEILVQMTPPLAFWCSLASLHPIRHRWTMELIDVALRFANTIEMRFKHALASLRPHEYSPQIQPMILTPGHSSYPSGHSTEAHMVALILRRLTSKKLADNSWGVQLMRQAHRVAVNRTIAGVHFPVDSAAGHMLGLTLAEYFIRRCTNSAGNADFQAWKFDGTKFGSKDDFDPPAHFNLANEVQQKANSSGGVTFADKVGGLASIKTSPLLEWLWKKAATEW
jgi:hypothetical protein